MATEKTTVLSGVFCIGISGTSGAGKSELARRLKKVLGESADVLAQDEYLLPKKYVSNGTTRFNFDDPDCIDNEDYREDAREKSKPILILEGFKCFQDPELVRLMDLKIWLNISKTLAKKRRKARAGKNYDEEYYESIVWRNHEAYEAHSRKQAWWKTVTVIDATKASDAVLVDAIRAISKCDAFPSRFATILERQLRTPQLSK
eukprot:g2917.t1